MIPDTPLPTPSVPATHTSIPMVTATTTALPTSTPKALPTLTATRTPRPIPTSRSALHSAVHSIEVVSMTSLGDEQVDFVLNVKNEGDLAIEEVAQVEMSIDGGAVELVNIIGALAAGESVSFAFSRSFDPGPHAIKFSVGNSVKTVTLDIASGDVAVNLVPTPLKASRPIPTATLTSAINPAPEPTITATPPRVKLVYRTPMTAPTPKPTQTPIPPTRTPRPTATPETTLPNPTYTPESEGLVSRFFKSAKDLTEANDSSQPDIDIEGIEALVHNLINQERVQRGLAAFYWDSEIAQIARDHSLEMGRENYLSHVNTKGQDASDRGSIAGYDCIKDYGSYYTFGLAENIHQGWLYSSITVINGVTIYNWMSMVEIADRAVEGWMRSGGHRKNILKDTYDRTGIGIAITMEGKVFMTQNFC